MSYQAFERSNSNLLNKAMPDYIPNLGFKLHLTDYMPDLRFKFLYRWSLDLVKPNSVQPISTPILILEKTQKHLLIDALHVVLYEKYS